MNYDIRNKGFVAHKPLSKFTESEQEHIISPNLDDTTTPSIFEHPPMIAGEYIPFDWLIDETRRFSIN
jgi:hypothetical protein